MPSKAEKERRKQLHRELAHKEYEEFINGLPIEQSLILELFDYLDLQLGERDCDHDFTITKDFLLKNGLDNDKIFDWFKKHGGYCDCEILYNVEGKFKNI